MGKNEELIKGLLMECRCMPYYRERVLTVVRKMEKQLDDVSENRVVVVDENIKVQKQLLELLTNEKNKRITAEKECQYLDSVISTMETKIDEIRKLIAKNN